MSLQSIVDICRSLDRFSDSPHPKFIEGHFNTVIDLVPQLESALKDSKQRGLNRADQVAAIGAVLRLRRMLGQAGLWSIGFFQQISIIHEGRVVSDGHRKAVLEIVQRTMQALRPVLAELEPIASRAAAVDELGSRPKPRLRTAAQRPLTKRQTKAVELDAKYKGNATEAAREMGISRPAYIQHRDAGYRKLPADARPKRLKKPRTQRLATDNRGGIVPSGGSKRKGGATLV